MWLPLAMKLSQGSIMFLLQGKKSRKKRICTNKRPTKGTSLKDFLLLPTTLPSLKTTNSVDLAIKESLDNCNIEKTRDESNKIDLKRLLNISIDEFNFTEVDDDPNSSSFPRFQKVFDDEDYLELEKAALKNIESEA